MSYARFGKCPLFIAYRDDYTVCQNANSKRTRNMSIEVQSPHRNDRICSKSTGWYFATREGLDMGPFPSRRSAEHEISFYLRSMAKLAKAS